ncbi:hypothetical protein KKF61_03535 [Patescibacteria group bacterium]|nr:hypothetical protein [Patescibacteria group bacterium]MBU0964525.1 hypothetical protein [Patescibacteria group bacterium]
MKHSLKIGFSFGLTSAIITTLGLMVGLEAGTSSRLAVIGGVITIAIADAFSDALGIHISEESENIHTTKEIWTSTLATFSFKAVFALMFIIPVIIFELSAAIVVSVAIGLLLLCILSFVLAKQQQEPPWKIVGEHLLIAVVVITITHYLGLWINKTFS